MCKLEVWKFTRCPHCTHGRIAPCEAAKTGNFICVHGGRNWIIVPGHCYICIDSDICPKCALPHHDIPDQSCPDLNVPPPPQSVPWIFPQWYWKFSNIEDKIDSADAGNVNPIERLYRDKTKAGFFDRLNNQSKVNKLRLRVQSQENVAHIFNPYRRPLPHFNPRLGDARAEIERITTYQGSNPFITVAPGQVENGKATEKVPAAGTFAIPHRPLGLGTSRVGLATESAVGIETNTNVVTPANITSSELLRSTPENTGSRQQESPRSDWSSSPPVMRPLRRIYGSSPLRNSQKIRQDSPLQSEDAQGVSDQQLPLRTVKFNRMNRVPFQYAGELYFGRSSKK